MDGMAAEVRDVLVTTAGGVCAMTAARADDGALVGRWLAELDGAARTRETYARGIRPWRAWLDSEGLTLWDVTRADVLRYRDSLEGRGLRAATVNTYLCAVRSLYQWLEASRVMPDVAAGVHARKIGQGGGKEALTLDQARRFLAPTGRGVEDLRNDAMACLMLRRGLRCVEVARADVGDVRTLCGQAVLYVEGKGRAEKDDYVVLGQECLNALVDYLAARGVRAGDDDGKPLFASASQRNEGGRLTTRSISRIIKTRLEACGVSSARVTAHSLRHTAVTFALLDGASVQDAQALARHADVSTTMIYAHNLEKLDARGERAVDDYIAAAS